MTDNNGFKARARKHQKATGDSYTRALRQVDRDRAASPKPDTTRTLLNLLQDCTADPAHPPLRVPLGQQPDGRPVWLDLREESDGGHGPHGIITGVGGAGKSVALASVVFAMCAQYTPDVVQVILADAQQHSAFHSFAGYPHVAATFTNLEDDAAAATEFVDSIRAAFDVRSRALRDVGMRIDGAPLGHISEYHDARRALGADLPALPYVIVVIDDVPALLRSNPDLKTHLDKLTRRGREVGVHLVCTAGSHSAAFRTLVGENLTWRIAFQSATEAESRWAIGTTDAAHIPADRRGFGYFVPGPGAPPIPFQSFYPPRSVIAATGRRLAGGGQ